MQSIKHAINLNLLSAWHFLKRGVHSSDKCVRISDMQDQNSVRALVFHITCAKNVSFLLIGLSHVRNHRHFSALIADRYWKSVRYSDRIYMRSRTAAKKPSVACRLGRSSR